MFSYTDVDPVELVDAMPKSGRTALAEADQACAAAGETCDGREGRQEVQQEDRNEENGQRLHDHQLLSQGNTKRGFCAGDGP